MKIKSITVRNYKRFTDPHTFSFTDSDNQVNDKTLLVGNNGCGKTSILQAIVSLIASLTRDNIRPDSIDWPGYEYRLLQSGRMPLQLEAEIVFSEAEIETTQQYSQLLKDKGVKLGVEKPSDERTVTISLDYEKNRILSNKGISGCYQFSGYQYAKKLAAFKKNKTDLFEPVGNIYWYNEQRNADSLSNYLETELPQLDFIRNFLSNAYSFHVAVTKGERQIMEGQFDFYEKLKRIYEQVFVDRTLVGAAPRFDIYEKSNAPDFFLSDGPHEYELSGMSAGERAIFPILMDFARWNINHSIVIIDEVELHLHPPLQQTLVRVLSKLGKDNQFIFTSHSNSVISMFNESENQIIRL